MVKNTTGGSKTKGQARKLVSDSKQSRALRISKDECEIYAQVTKTLGNGMCHVSCMDDINRLCHIRGKFRGRGKRDNFVGLGSWILVGLREWESEKDKDDKKLSNCDLLEVYNESDKEKLKTTVTHLNWSSFISNDNQNSKIDSKASDMFEFSDEKTDEYQMIMQEEYQKTRESNNKITIGSIQEDEIDIDDI